MSSPFTPQEIDDLKTARGQWTAALNLFGAGLLALTLPYLDSLQKGEWAFFGLLSLILSLYVAVMALTREFPAALQKVKDSGTDEQKIFVKQEIMGLKSIWRSWLYCIAWISMLLAMGWTAMLMEGDRKKPSSPEPTPTAVTSPAAREPRQP